MSLQLQYPQFRTFLEAKLRIDARAIGSEEERVWYGFGRLSDIPSEFNVSGFLKQLDQSFADPQRQTKALNKINSIRQGNLDFRTAGLNRELCDRLVTQAEPDKYTDFTAQLRMILDKLQQIIAWVDQTQWIGNLLKERLSQLQVLRNNRVDSKLSG
ncbi:hypothetical protein BJ878DRAFT_515250 [Calycina marina]|uniref:Uncharacterized protein n=1 Tax=Calycina marina TaxID=1763456 RepID=A0A9P7YYU7_9HELO|nr:hypothetical protein BJ878DRAFT_515250 [Calycina marina]